MIAPSTTVGNLAIISMNIIVNASKCLAILSEEKHANIFKDMEATFPVQYIAGGATQNVTLTPTYTYTYTLYNHLFYE
jgi:energy-converting hydrogenase Eha subunit A